MRTGVRGCKRALVLASVALHFSATPASAQSQTGVALAETLYQQARDLMAAGRHDEACPKFEESYRLDPATGTLLNLASCHEHQEKFATAWFEYMDAVTAARRDGRQDRVSFAQSRLAELEPKLSRLTLVVPAAADHPELELELDGARIGRAARGVPTPVDPGSHVVEARAPGRQSFRVTVEVGKSAEQKIITVPELPLIAPVAAKVVAPPPSAKPAPAAPPVDQPKERPIPTSAIVSGAVTGGLLVAAFVTGGLYLDKKGDYETSGSEDDWDSARTLAIANGALFIGAAAGAGLTTYFYVTRPEEPRQVAASRPRTAPSGIAAGFVVRY